MRFELNDTIVDLTLDLAERFEAGRHVAEVELRLLERLAQAIRRAIAEWRLISETMETAKWFDNRRATTLVLETVFDEVLAPAAWRVLSELIIADET